MAQFPVSSLPASLHHRLLTWPGLRRLPLTRVSRMSRMFWTDHTRILHIQRLLYIIGTMLARQTSHANQRSFWNGRKREAGQGETCPLPKEPYWTLTPFFVSKIVGFMMLNVPYYHNLPYKVQKFSLFYILLGSPRPLTKTQMHKFYSQKSHVYHYNVQAMGKKFEEEKNISQSKSLTKLFLPGMWHISPTVEK